MSRRRVTIYRKCGCGETAHSLAYVPNGNKIEPEGRACYYWACRNCGAPANGRNRKPIIELAADRDASTKALLSACVACGHAGHGRIPCTHDGCHCYHEGHWTTTEIV